MGHVACMGDMRNQHTMKSEKLKERDHLGDLGQVSYSSHKISRTELRHRLIVNAPQGSRSRGCRGKESQRCCGAAVTARHLESLRPRPSISPL
jgi:hypothetical protein